MACLPPSMTNSVYKPPMKNTSPNDNPKWVIRMGVGYLAGIIIGLAIVAYHI